MFVLICSRFVGICSLILLLGLTYASAQLPVISALDKKFGTVNAIVSITGSNFGSDKSKLKVTFGAVEGEVINATNNIITAKVPPGATYGNIAITNLQSGLSGYSNDFFLLSFSGSGFDPTAISTVSAFSSNPGLNEHCLADLDNDGLVDIAAANTGHNDLSIFRNTSTLTSISFVKTNVTINATSINIAAMDLDGDGKIDLVASKSGGTGDQVFVLRNTSTIGNISFAPALVYFTAGNIIKKIILKDLEKDGKPEIIATGESGNVLSVFRNTSTLGNINFNFSPLTLPVAGSSATSNLLVEDLNNDGLPDIMSCSFLGQDIFVLLNKSTSTTISFNPAVSFKVNSGINNMVAGDFNGDGKSDIAITNFSLGTIIFLLNKTFALSTSILFAPAVNFNSSTGSWGLDAGDLDGDGKADIIASSNDVTKKLALLRNISVGDSLNFEKSLLLSSNEKSKSIKIGDLNNDGKPDISFAGVDNSNILVIQNKNCVLPTISSNNPLAVCKGFALQLKAPEAIGVIYEWSLNSNPLPSSNKSFWDVTTSGKYKVSISNADGSCKKITKDTSAIVIDPASTAPQVPIIVKNTTLCTRDSVKLEAGGDFLEYLWSTGEKTKIIYAKKADEYTVDVKVTGGCTANGQLLITEIPSPEITISAEKTKIKKGESLPLSASGGGINYIWSPSYGLNDSLVSNPIASPAQTTTYTVRSKGSNGCTGYAQIIVVVESDVLDINPLKVFTPNSDGTQDLWVIDNIESYPEYKVIIFSRSGEVLFQAQPYRNNWDGTVKGKMMAEGDYYYLIKSDFSKKSKTGSFLLLR